MFFKKPKVAVQPAWLIVGLGNPGGEYRGTRHNVGWEVIDLLAEKYRIKMDRAKHQARIGAGAIDETPVMLVKPLTYMNLSGRAVAPIMREANLTPQNVLVIADDMDLEVGKVRLRMKGSPGGHNGHKSLKQSLHTEEYPRLKIGIGHGGSGSIDHVLSPFSRDERSDMDRAVRLCAEGVLALITSGENGALKVLESQ
jgi:PTH1 family peptidyl-tRNA hydrolase